MFGSKFFNLNHQDKNPVECLNIINNASEQLAGILYVEKNEQGQIIGLSYSKKLLEQLPDPNFQSYSNLQNIDTPSNTETKASSKD